MILTYWSGAACSAGFGAAPNRWIPRPAAGAARHAEQFEDKLVIARRVAEELPQDGVVVLRFRFSHLALRSSDAEGSRLAVVTNNLPAAQYLAEYDNLRIFTLPGTIRGLTSAAVDAWTSRRLSTQQLIWRSSASMA